MHTPPFLSLDDDDNTLHSHSSLSKTGTLDLLHTLLGVYQFGHAFFTSVSLSLLTSLSVYLSYVLVHICIDR